MRWPFQFLRISRVFAIYILLLRCRRQTHDGSDKHSSSCVRIRSLQIKVTHVVPPRRTFAEQFGIASSISFFLLFCVFYLQDCCLVVCHYIRALVTEKKRELDEIKRKIVTQSSKLSLCAAFRANFSFSQIFLNATKS